MAGTNGAIYASRKRVKHGATFASERRAGWRRSPITRICLYLIATALLALMVLPYVYLMLQSLAPWNQVDRVAIPSSLTMRSYIWLLAGGEASAPQPWVRAFMNSVSITLVSTFLQVTLGAVVGYSLSILRFRGATMVYSLIMFQMFYPGIILLVPTFLLIQWMGIYNTFWAMLLPSSVSLFAIFMFTNFFQTIPAEMIEAARLDGANDMTILLWIVLPMAQSITMVVSFFLFVDRWTTLLWDLLVVKDPELQTLNVLITTMFGPYGTYPGPLYASGVLLTLPLIILFLVFSRSFVSGVQLVLK